MGSTVAVILLILIVLAGAFLRESLRTEAVGKWGVEPATQEALAFWSSDRQAAAIDAWPHDTDLAAEDDYVLVRVPGLIRASRLDDLLAYADSAREFFLLAAARRSAPR